MEKLKMIVSRVLFIDINQINDELARGNPEEWDSFNHLLIIAEIEKEMNAIFTPDEVKEIKTFKELREMVSGKLNGD